MAYSDFTLKEVTNRFELHTEEKPDVFSEVPEGEVSALLQSLLQVYVPLALAIHTEKARSEFMIAPLLAEVLTHAPRPVSLFSGVDFSVDHSISNLFGVATTSSLWQFLKLRGKTMTIDRREYHIERIAKIVGILMWMICTVEDALVQSEI